MKTLIDRLYSDYAMPSQLAKHESAIVAAADAGYAQISVREFVRGLPQRAHAHARTLVHRHDIDTDLRTARKLFEIEKRHQVRSSFYFRLSTLDFRLMHEIEEYGGEASYHYEELATFAKRHRIKRPTDVMSRLPEIKEEFASNFLSIERTLGSKMTTVASHGDFANRRLKLHNTIILGDAALRTMCGITCEAYDAVLMNNTDIYISDRPHPQYFYPTTPRDALGRHARIYLLTHPRQFETNWIENTKENLARLYQSLIW
ncbi:hypothetical protein [Massilia sp. DWR3-1-1]|uniref:hypothetical protein n=1 Tax=Massilia sp. DWR3-1-1 TaxID=2804559 RepID=UPI003CF508F8